MVGLTAPTNMWIFYGYFVGFHEVKLGYGILYLMGLITKLI
jgi:hypothetical protein